ncbi:hypothetical protein NOCA2240034 [metagenome]|uniref:Uncharacterized protein n=1 Tax=metagenome TaxID=256318 RepID=A0A2P2C3G0_9ZZZZ
MKNQARTRTVRWRVDKTSSTGFAVLTHQGDADAVDVQVQMSRGTDVPFIYAGLGFRQIAAGAVLRLARHSQDPSLPSWNVVTVTWREGNRWERRRLHRWQGVLSPDTSIHPSRRSLVSASSGIRVPSPRRPL